jgi:hypothetical protein
MLYFPSSNPGKEAHLRRLSLSFAVLLCGVAASVALTHPGASRADAATEPVFVASNNPMTFDFVGVGATSATKTTTVTNQGTAPLVLSRVLLGGRDYRDFRLTSDTCTGASLAPGATCAVGVAFAPSATGTLVAWLRFTDNSPCYDWVNIAGSGTETATRAMARPATCTSGTTTATTTTTTTTPGSTVPATTTPGGDTVSGSSVVTFTKGCISRRTVTVGLQPPKGKSFKAVKILLRGKTIKTLTGKAIKTKVPLKGLPRGRFTVEVRATTTDGERYVRKHFYVTCVAAKS